MHVYVGTNKVSFRGELLLKIDAGSIQTQDLLKLNLPPSHLPVTAQILRNVLQQALFCCSPCGPGSFSNSAIREV